MVGSFGAGDEVPEGMTAFGGAASPRERRSERQQDQQDRGRRHEEELLVVPDAAGGDHPFDRSQPGRRWRRLGLIGRPGVRAGHLVRIEPQIARIRAKGRAHVDVAGKDVEVLPLERIELIDAEPGVARRLVERDASHLASPPQAPSRPLPEDQ